MEAFCSSKLTQTRQQVNGVVRRQRASGWAMKSKTDARRREARYKLLALLMFVTGVLAGGWAAVTPLDSTVAAEIGLSSGSGEKPWLAVVWPVPYALIIVAVLFYLAAEGAVPRAAGSSKAPAPAVCKAPAPAVCKEGASPGVGQISDPRATVEREERLFPEREVSRLRWRDNGRGLSVCAAVFFAFATLYCCKPDGRPAPDTLTDDPNVMLFIVGLCLSVGYAAISFWRWPLEWPCPACGQAVPRVSRASKRGTVLRFCSHCRVDWDTGEDPNEGGSGQGG
jgi:hypothetical protein